MKVVVDTNVLVSAKAVRADLIVSGDSHLLSLGRWRGVRIVKPREAIEIINGETIRRGIYLCFDARTGFRHVLSSILSRIWRFY